MFKQIGYAIFPTTWQQQKNQLSSLFREGSTIFTSLHIAEEFCDDYTENVLEMLSYCTSLGYKIMADVSPRTLTIFGCHSLKELSESLNLQIIRVDYGFTLEAIVEASKSVSICLNASTLQEDWLQVLHGLPQQFYAMHNYYPRPETGLDVQQFHKKNLILNAFGIKAIAFIPGDLIKRGPLFEGLPTLEYHRNLTPYAAFVSMSLTHKVEWVFVGDGTISDQQSDWIHEACVDQVYSIPIVLDANYNHLDNTIFTIRSDSPSTLIRFKESRAYATQGMTIPPYNCQDRHKGTLTIDNIKYKRYSGEIQLTKANFPSDERVNVIGKVPEAYHVLLEALPNGTKIKLHKL
ncbi:MupG family TIM beta-alpha barrel fold protein [Fusibacter ferrireducens]|uniref:DUF871 family protein n=1 Tax=Fusibacter ferrireducens TaxID=2785058 RepID=A0ABR9ZS62_9FIRM|nr:MupG family TIM beta-alpha barrel fold protein [Fusibacter ferrireducens]MBF4692958.1 DUF871 family protein [Fusibacter ferrireducens]